MSSGTSSIGPDKVSGRSGEGQDCCFVMSMCAILVHPPVMLPHRVLYTHLTMQPQWPMVSATDLDWKCTELLLHRAEREHGLSSTGWGQWRTATSLTGTAPLCWRMPVSCDSYPDGQSTKKWPSDAHTHTHTHTHARTHARTHTHTPYTHTHLFAG